MSSTSVLTTLSSLCKQQWLLFEILHQLLQMVSTNTSARGRLLVFIERKEQEVYRKSKYKRFRCWNISKVL